MLMIIKVFCRKRLSDLRQTIINSRIKNLQNQIDNFRRLIAEKCGG